MLSQELEKRFCYGDCDEDNCRCNSIVDKVEHIEVEIQQDLEILMSEVRNMVPLEKWKETYVSIQFSLNSYPRVATPKSIEFELELYWKNKFIEGKTFAEKLNNLRKIV